MPNYYFVLLKRVGTLFFNSFYKKITYDTLLVIKTRPCYLYGYILDSNHYYGGQNKKAFSVEKKSCVLVPSILGLHA